DRHAATEPGVLRVGGDVLHPEVHAEAASIDSGAAQCLGEHVERGSSEQSRRPAAAAVGCAECRLDQPHSFTNELRHGVGPRAVDEPGSPWPRMEPRLDLLSPLDRGTDELAVLQAQGERVRVLVVLGADALQRAAVLVVDEAPGVGDEVEAAIAPGPTLEQLDFVDEVERGRFDRCQRDPGNAADHLVPPNCAAYGPGPPSTADPARAASSSAS